MSNSELVRLIKIELNGRELEINRLKRENEKLRNYRNEYLELLRANNDKNAADYYNWYKLGNIIRKDK